MAAVGAVRFRVLWGDAELALGIPCVQFSHILVLVVSAYCERVVFSGRVLLAGGGDHLLHPVQENGHILSNALPENF